MSQWGFEVGRCNECGRDARAVNVQPVVSGASGVLVAHRQCVDVEDCEQARELAEFVASAASEADSCLECGSADVIVFFSHGIGELVGYCAVCARREFGWRGRRY
jgi:hypothetical protein